MFEGVINRSAPERRVAIRGGARPCRRHGVDPHQCRLLLLVLLFLRSKGNHRVDADCRLLDIDGDHCTLHGQFGHLNFIFPNSDAPLLHHDDGDNDRTGNRHYEKDAEYRKDGAHDETSVVGRRRRRRRRGRLPSALGRRRNNAAVATRNEITRIRFHDRSIY